MLRGHAYIWNAGAKSGCWLNRTNTWRGACALLGPMWRTSNLTAATIMPVGAAVLPMVCAGCCVPRFVLLHRVPTLGHVCRRLIKLSQGGDPNCMAATRRSEFASAVPLRGGVSRHEW